MEPAVPPPPAARVSADADGSGEEALKPWYTRTTCIGTASDRDAHHERDTLKRDGQLELASGRFM